LKLKGRRFCDILEIKETKRGCSRYYETEVPTMAELLDKVHYFTREQFRRRNNGIISSSNFLCVLCTKCMKRMHIGLVMSVCLSICMIQLENHWMDLDEIWYRGCASGDYPKIIHFNFLPSVITKWWMKKLVRWDLH
jgi:hypothetical protein